MGSAPTGPVLHFLDGLPLWQFPKFMQILHLNQSGPDWLKWRQAGIGGSDAGVISGNYPYLSEEQLKLSKREGNKSVVKENYRMKRGKRLEPIARAKYQDLTGIRVRPICCVHDTYPWLRASLDGLSFDGKTALEIKCPSNFNHETALSGYVPNHYIAQCQHILLVTGCPVLHYFSFTDSEKFPVEQQFALVKVLPDQEYMDWLLDREKKWWEENCLTSAEQL